MDNIKEWFRTDVLTLSRTVQSGDGNGCTINRTTADDGIGQLLAADMFISPLIPRIIT